LNAGPVVGGRCGCGQRRPARIAAKMVPAGAGRVREYVGPLTWGLAMPGLLLTGVALCAALIMMAALIVIRHWRRSNRQFPAPVGALGAASGPARRAMASHDMAIVPGFSDTVPPGPGAQVRVPSAQAAHPQARPVVSPQPDPHGPGPLPNGQRATARAVTTSEHIASYYDQADKPLADYLTALGWIHQPAHSPQPPGPAERARQHPPSGGPGQ
jgi:hypothetical protein